MNRSIAFLFDSTDPSLGNSYGDACISNTILALLIAYEGRKLHFRIMVGDVLLHSMAERKTTISVNKSSNDCVLRNETCTTVSADRSLLNALLWDLIDNVEEQWHTVNLEEVIRPLTGNALFSITVINLLQTTASEVDKILRGKPGYIGALHIDLGNPVQQRVFATTLLDEAIIDDKTLFIRSEDPVQMIAPSWSKNIGISKIIVMHDYDLFELAPKLDLPNQLSEAGKRTLELLNAKNITIRARLMDHVVSMRDIVKEPEFRKIQLALTNDSSLFEAVVSEQKLTQYVLSKSHQKGKHKAQLFSDLLGIEQGDWRYLAAQLLRGLTYAKIERVRFSMHGVKYSAYIPVLGLNGKKKTVATGWIAFEGEPARLTSAMVADKCMQVDSNIEAPLVVSSVLSPETRFQEIYKTAVREGIVNAENVVPMPMRIGRTLEREGACGNASIRIIDARSSFVRWLRLQGIGSRHYRRGWQIYADTDFQSLERNKAYARAFAEVLILNGICCEVEEWLN